MKRALGFAYMTLIVLGLIHTLSPRLEAQNRSWNRINPPRDGACFYRDAYFRGDGFCLSAGDELRNVGDRHNDMISSVRIFGRAQVIVYEHANFRGASWAFNRDVSNLQGWNDWNDSITAIQVTRGQFRGQQRDQQRDQYGDRGRDYEPRSGACFYLDAGYRGGSFCMNAGESLRNVGDRFNDQISSIRVFGRARVVVHEHENFRGASRTVADDVFNLVGNFNDRITSIEVR